MSKEAQTLQQALIKTQEFAVMYGTGYLKMDLINNQLVFSVVNDQFLESQGVKLKEAVEITKQ